MNGRRFTTLEIEAVWDGYAAGDTASVIARRLGRPCQTVAERIRDAGGVRPIIPKAPERALTLAEREELSRGLTSDSESIWSIACRLGRAPSTLSREVERNGGATAYRLRIRPSPSSSAVPLAMLNGRPFRAASL